MKFTFSNTSRKSWRETITYLMAFAMLSISAVAVAQQEVTQRVSNDDQLLQAMESPEVREIFLEGGYYAAFEDYMKEGTRVIKPASGNRSFDCVYWIQPSSICYDTDTTWIWNTANAGTLDPFLCGCCPPESSGSWAPSPGYTQPGNLVLVGSPDQYSIDFKVDAPGTYSLRYTWGEPYNSYVETIYTFTETYTASLAGSDACALSTMVHFEYSSVSPEENVTLGWTLNGAPYAGPAVNPDGDTLDFLLTVPNCGEWILEATLTPENCDPVIVSDTFNLYGDGDPVISGVGSDTVIICPAEPVFSTPSASDPCGQGARLTYETDTIPGDCPDHYTVVRTWTATNDCNNTATATQVIEHLPNPNPEIVLGLLDIIPGDTVFAGCDETVTIPFPEIETPCGPADVYYERSDGGLWTDPFPEGETEVCYWGISPCGYSTDTLCFPVIVDPCDVVQPQHCTMTQGFYGNPGGLYCDDTGTADLIEDLLSQGDLVLGSGGNTMTFQAGDSDCIIGFLPGGGPAKAITGENSCASHPGIKLKKGKFHNILLAQALTLGLNLRLDGELGGLEVLSDTLRTAPSSGCGEEGDTIAGPYVKYPIPLSVYNVLTENGNITATIDDLYALANTGLGGGDVGATSLGDIADALGAINDGFDECAFGSFQPVQYLQSAAIEGGIAAEEEASSTDLHIYPNPFSRTANIEFTATESSHAVVEVYTMTGARVATLYDGRVEEGLTYRLTFTGTPGVKQLNYICVIRTAQETQIQQMIMMR